MSNGMKSWSPSHPVSFTRRAYAATLAGTLSRGHVTGRRGHYLLLLAAGLGLFFVNLGGASLWDVDEGRNSGAAMAMWESGHWIVPTFNGTLRVDKPPLLYWLQATCFHLFGLNEFAARFPSAVASLLTVFCCYELGRRLFSPSAGLLAALVAAASPMVCAAARFANPDALLNLCAVLTMWIFWRGLQSPERQRRDYRRPTGWWHFSVGLSMGLGMLAKGPVGWVLPQTAIVLALAWNRQLDRLWDRRCFLAVLGFGLAAIPWHIAVFLATKWDLIHGFFVNHNVNRFLSVMESHHGSMLYYPAVVLVGFAPWSIFLGFVLWFEGGKALRRHSGSEPRTSVSGSPQPSSDPRGHRFLWCWIGVYLVFFSLSATKLPNYILPVVVPLSLLTGRFLDRWRTGAIRVKPWLEDLAFAALVLVGLAIVLGLLLTGGALDMSFMQGRFFPELIPWAPLGLVPIAGAVLARRLARRGQRTAAVTGLMASVILVIVPAAAWVSAALNGHKAPRSLVELSRACQPHREIRIGSWQVGDLASLSFYCRRDVLAPKTEQEAMDLLRYPIPVFLFLSESAWHDLDRKEAGLGRVVGRHRNLYSRESVVVVRNWE